MWHARKAPVCWVGCRGGKKEGRRVSPPSAFEIVAVQERPDRYRPDSAFSCRSASSQFCSSWPCWQPFFTQIS